MIAIFGLPIPRSDPPFLAVLTVHVACGLIAVIWGMRAMVLPKGRGRHSASGKVYFWALVGVSLTMGILSFWQWAKDWPLAMLGTIALLAAIVGRRSSYRSDIRSRHVIAMGTSYIALLTAFYVDNGPNFPVWREIPLWAMWVLPSAVGLPFIVKAVRRLRSSARIVPPGDRITS
jgi:uncharacterized membrane protein